MVQLSHPYVWFFLQHSNSSVHELIGKLNSTSKIRFGSLTLVDSVLSPSFQCQNTVFQNWNQNKLIPNYHTKTHLFFFCNVVIFSIVTYSFLTEHVLLLWQYFLWILSLSININNVLHHTFSIKHNYQRWSWNSNTLATWCKEPIIRKNPDAGNGWR